MKHGPLAARAGVTLTLLVGLFLSSIPAQGQGSDLKNKLIGTWAVTVTRATAPPGQPLSFPVSYSFLPGGVMLETGSASLFRSPGHGVWERTQGRQYTAAFSFYRFAPDGQYLGTQRSTLHIELAQAGDEFTATSEFQILAPDGSVVAAGQATAAGQRVALPE